MLSSNRLLPKDLLYFYYLHFHDHLPEELFFDDFLKELKLSNKQTFKNYSKVFESDSDIDHENDVLTQVIVKVTCKDLVQEEDPVVRKLALYTVAHRNYLSSLPYEVMRDYKINWGLK